MKAAILGGCGIYRNAVAELSPMSGRFFGKSVLGSVDIRFQTQWSVKPYSTRRTGAGVVVLHQTSSTMLEGGFTDHLKGSSQNTSVVVTRT
ncbi:hypothetical protein [Endozoicomonas sp.]|uniref:hypothetical protein n=1 Tax=Endozoicomonas sp. TaxID=1892382 RepID=UPI003AF6F35F